MKKLFLLTAIFVLVAFGAALAQAPQQFNYQGAARNANGTPLANKPISLRISILDGSASGSAQYVETRNVTTNLLGLYNVIIGSPGAITTTGSMAAVTWQSGLKYIKIEVDVNSGNNYSIAGTAQLLSVPYALYAANSPAGVQGPKGDTGLTGVQGPQGLPGEKGNIGPTGPQGPKGDVGLTGATGPQGLPGEKGNVGPTGAQRPKGDVGLTGAPGPQGLPGEKGNVGPTGTQGLKGDTGLTGATGPQGLPGEKGDAGPVGAQGPKGDTGLTGVTGPQGLPGEKGDIGPVGAQGTQGLKGDIGLTGDIGPQGPIGATGADGQGGVSNPGAGIVITGAGTVASPYVISANSPAINMAGDVTGTAGANVIAPNAVTTTKIAAGANNTVLATNATGDVVWVAPTLATAINGVNTLTTPGQVELGGALTKPTTITADATNTLALAGLQTGAATDSILVVKNDVVKKVAKSSFEQDLRRVGNYNHITQDAGVGNNGTDAGTGQDNIGIGKSTLTNITTGLQNTAVGFNSLYNLTTGQSNTAYGENSGHTVTAGNGNTLLGPNSGLSLTTGGYNTFIGNGSGFPALTTGTGSRNIAIGNQAQVQSATASNQLNIANNIFGTGLSGTVGAPAGNIGIGIVAPTNRLHVRATANPLKLDGLVQGLATDSLLVVNNGVVKRINTNSIQSDLRMIGNNNHLSVDAGMGANGTNPGTGDSNVGIGNSTLSSITMGDVNVAIGNSGLAALTTGSGNIGLGDGTGATLTTGNYNTLIGGLAGYNITTGNSNIAIGKNTDLANPTASGQLNIANNIFGTGLSGTVTAPAGNIGIGVVAPTNTLHVRATTDPLKLEGLQNGLSTDSVLVVNNDVVKKVAKSSFEQDLRMVDRSNHITLDAGNNSDGTSTGTGARNIGIGTSALAYNTSGSENAAIGYMSLKYNTTGINNFAGGVSALEHNMSGSFNVGFGYGALMYSNGDDNIAIGRDAGANLTEGNGNIIIGTDIYFHNSTGSRQLNIGNVIFGTEIGGSSAKIGIGVEEPENALHVKGFVDPLKLEGLQAGLATDNILVENNGVVKTISPAVLRNTNIIKITANYNVLAADYTILANATTSGFALTLPSAATSTGRILVIRKTDETANVLTFTVPIKVSETTSITTLNINSTIRIQSDGTDWYKID